jgi:hypothetical protein
MIRAWPIVAVLVGTLFGALLFAVMGSFSGHGLLASILGAVVGAGVSLGTWSGRISVPTTGGIVVAVLAATVGGPGCDDYSGVSAVPGFLVGMLLTRMARAAVGWLGLRALFFIPGAATGMIALVTGTSFWSVVFLVVVFLTLAWDPDHQTTPLSPRTRSARKAKPPGGANRANVIS